MPKAMSDENVADVSLAKHLTCSPLCDSEHKGSGAKEQKRKHSKTTILKMIISNKTTIQTIINKIIQTTTNNQSNVNNNSANSSTTSQINLPKTGWNNIMLVITTVIVAICAVVSFVKYKKIK